MKSLRVVDKSEVRPSRRQGGRIRFLIGPHTTGWSVGILGTLDLAPGEYISEHYHPYSDETVYVVSGQLVVEAAGERVEVYRDQALELDRLVPHRFINEGSEPVFGVFYITPLAPSPELGHVDTEAPPYPEDSPPSAGASA